ncbi:CUB and sushi domain-containing protein 3, partial [Araneus ventricosus]
MNISVSFTVYEIGPLIPKFVYRWRYCQDPGIPEGANRTDANGIDDSSPRTYREGESVHFSCKEKDSLLHGPEIITCGSNATWSNSLPRCEGYRLGTRTTVTCPDPGVPENGNRMNADGTDASYNQIFKEGRSLRFACRENIDVYGMTLITCRSDGTWSDSPPICNTPLVCSLRVDGVGFFNCTRVMEGTSCDITCDGKLMGRFNCFDEDWFPRLPYCTSSKAIYRDQKEEEKRAKASCPDPETPEGAQRKDFARPPGSDPAVFTEGESVVFYCDEDGTFNHKRFFITCESDGTWSEATGQVTRCNSTLE